MKTIKTLAVIGLAFGILAAGMPASATSWFGGSKQNQVVGGALIKGKGNTQTYSNPEPMQIINEGGWGTLPQESYLTAADMEILSGYLKMQQEQMKMMRDQAAAQRKVYDENAAMRRAIDKANLATSINNKPAAPTSTTQQSSGNFVVPKAPVREWDAINKANQQNAPQPQ